MPWWHGVDRVHHRGKIQSALAVVVVMSPRSPYDALASALAEAFAAIIQHAVADAVAGITPTADTAAMVDVPEAASRIGLSVSKTKRLIAAGDLGSVVVGRRRLVPVSAIDTYVHRLEDVDRRASGSDPVKRRVRRA